MNIFSGKFGKIYFTSLAVLTAGISLWLLFIWLRLDAYEKSIPENAAKLVFNKYFKELAFDKLLARESSYVSKLETLDNYAAYIKERAGSGERNFIKIPEDSEGIRKYVVFADAVGFAEFEMKERNGLFGKVWRLSGVRTVYNSIDTIKVVVPTGCDVYVNNKAAGSNYKTGAGISGVMSGKYDIYTISELIAVPVIEARSNGRNLDLSFDSEVNEYSAIPVITADIFENYTLFVDDTQIDDSFLIRDGIKTEESDRLKLYRKIYRIPYGLGGQPKVSIVNNTGKEGIIKETDNYRFIQEFAYDRDLEKQFRERAIAAAKTYSRFMTFNTTIKELQRYFESGTQIYQMIRTSEVYFYTPHKDNWFENEKASEFLATDSSSFSCRVTFDNFQRRNAGELFRFPLDVTLFFRRVGGQFMVHDLTIN